MRGGMGGYGWGMGGGGGGYGESMGEYEGMGKGSRAPIYTTAYPRPHTIPHM